MTTNAESINSDNLDLFSILDINTSLHISHRDCSGHNDTFLCTFVQGRWQPTQSQLIQMYSVDWTDVYDTHNIEHRTELVSH